MELSSYCCCCGLDVLRFAVVDCETKNCVECFDYCSSFSSSSEVSAASLSSVHFTAIDSRTSVKNENNEECCERNSSAIAFCDDGRQRRIFSESCANSR